MPTSEGIAAAGLPGPVFMGAPGHLSTLTLTLSREALGALDAYLQSGAAQGLAFEDALRQAVCTGPPAPAPSSRRCTLSLRTLRKVHEFIQDNLTRDICVEDIAQAAFLSPYHLGRSYRQATGKSLWQYVLQCRARLARSMIAAQPQTSLGDIAAACGFESYSQFIAAFRKAYVLTPSSYRRLLEHGAQ